jgi:hypothetical protein
MKRTIPQIRELIAELTDEAKRLARRQLHIATKIAELSEETRKRSYTRGPDKNRRMTASLRADIRAFAQQNPSQSHQEIGEAFKVNPGRVSEALHGRRGE